MAAVNNTTYAHAAYQNAYHYDAAGAKKNETGISEAIVKEATNGKTWAAAGEKMTEVAGYGKPQLSEKGMEYYNSLVKKYGHMNFVLVSSDKKQEAEMMKGSFANASKTTVLIDTDKIEQMARDEGFRAKYEGILNNAQLGLTQLQNKLGSSGAGVKAFGMSVNKDGRSSFFAVMDKSMAAQRERITQRHEEKAKAKKEEAKKADKEKKNERSERSEATDRNEHTHRNGRTDRNQDETVTLKADSIDALMKKIQDFYQEGMFNSVRTEEEMMVGGQINYGV